MARGRDGTNGVGKAVATAEKNRINFKQFLPDLYVGRGMEESMTIEKAQELCENSEYNSEAKNVIRRGLEIMEKYCDDVDVQGEHDVIYAAPFSEDMSEEDVRVLADLNWHVDTDCDRWAHF